MSFSKTGKTLYYRGRTLQRVAGGGAWGGNHVDTETREDFWISGVKINKEDRHWAGPGKVEIDPDAADEYKRLFGP